MTMKKEKAECGLLDEFRCTRTDNKSWRCSNLRVKDSNYCEHHRDNLRANYKKRKTRKNGSPQKIVIGITKQCLSNKYKIKKPKIAKTAVLSDDLFGLENLKDVLTMEAWREHLTPTERCHLRSLLPEGHKNNTVVESLLSGQNFNFGNPALVWGASVCKGEQFPGALLQREQELKLSQSQYFKDIKTYRDTMLENLDEISMLCESCNQNDKMFRKKLKQWMAKRDKRKK